MIEQFIKQNNLKRQLPLPIRFGGIEQGDYFISKYRFFGKDLIRIDYAPVSDDTSYEPVISHYHIF